MELAFLDGNKAFEKMGQTIVHEFFLQVLRQTVRFVSKFMDINK